MRKSMLVAALGAAIVLTAAIEGCGRARAQADASGNAEAASAAPPGTAGGTQTPDAGGKVIPVEVLTDEAGNNVFRPNVIHARKGDVIRFTLKQGVHNVDFLADSNSDKSGLPKASDLLQLPGQTYDVKVTFEKGDHYFQCDPHSALGMKGHLIVD